MPDQVKAERKKGTSKRWKGKGIRCRWCGEPTYVTFTRPQGREGVARTRRCACGWVCRTAEVIVEEVKTAAA
jgi:hypothetical protein